VMALAQAVGAYFGSRMVLSRGTALIKPMLILCTIAIALRLLVSQMENNL